jgi:flagellar basal body-associated protein FliL
LDEVMGASSATKGVLAHIFIELALEVRDRETQLKVEARKTELKSLVASQVSEYSKDQLKTSEGQMQLKADVMTEINHLIQGGVEDVLFSKFTVK